jgi:hypothetical protein
MLAQGNALGASQHTSPPSPERAAQALRDLLRQVRASYFRNCRLTQGVALG